MLMDNDTTVLDSSLPEPAEEMDPGASCADQRAWERKVYVYGEILLAGDVIAYLLACSWFSFHFTTLLLIGIHHTT
jgi:hypothetical protein